MSSLRDAAVVAAGQKRKLSPDHIDDKSDGEDGAQKGSSKLPQEEARRKVNEAGEAMFELSGKRRVTVRKFKGKVLVDIREYWETKEGEMAPGKKGISLSEEQWRSLKDMVDKVDEAIAEAK